MRHRQFATEGSNIHNAAPSILQMGQCSKDGVQRRPEMDLQRPLEILTAHRLKWSDYDFAGIVDQEIDPIESLGNRRDGCSELRLITNIANPRRYYRSVTTQFQLG
jgi:hypothetical protein